MIDGSQVGAVLVAILEPTARYLREVAGAGEARGVERVCGRGGNVPVDWRGSSGAVGGKGLAVVE